MPNAQRLTPNAKCKAPSAKRHAASATRRTASDERRAERLTLRDRQHDDRRLCMECNYLAGFVLGGWRCGSHRAAQVGRDLPAVLVTMAQRCPGFAL